ncbi:MAG: hypothetical protein Q9187_003168, partial [Circinaria calcarea]
MSHPPPIGPKWLTSATESQRHICRTAIVLAMQSLQEPPVERGSASAAGPTPPSVPFVVSSHEYNTPRWDPEPLPYLNYSLIHTLITLCRADLGASDLRDYNRVVSARAVYFARAESFWHQYRGLADALTATQMLQQEIETVQGRMIREDKYGDGDVNMEQEQEQEH